MCTALPAAPPALQQPLAEVGLVYVSNRQPGFRRQGSAAGAVYLDLQGRRITDDPTLRRIRALAIPPAWTNVWICPDPGGHLQATGRDARGRKQYRYHRRWNELRSEHKYGRLLQFARALPAIRRIARAHLRQRALTREKVLAAVVGVLETTLIRVGCEEYARSNDSYGLATLRRRHVRVSGRQAVFDFRGKSGLQHRVEIRDPALVQVIRRCHELPGYELFKFVDDAGAVQDVSSGDINDYIRQVARADFTAKDFRTWGGTVAAALALVELGYAPSAAQRKRHIATAIKQAAAGLRNLPATCRNYYVHPAIVEAYEAGTLIEQMHAPPQRSAPRGLSAAERAVYGVLRRAAREAAGGHDLTTRLRASIRRRKAARAPGRSAAARLPDDRTPVRG